METLNKVAKVSLLFWCMKIVATTLGETAGDFISMTLNLGYLKGLLITTVIFSVLLFIQLKSKKYTSTLFWLTIVATTTLGTEISDFLDRSLGAGYLVGTVTLLSGLIVTLLIWHRQFGNLSVEPIVGFKKETLYWIAILFSNSLGTAFGDFLSDNLGLSYLTGAAITATIILIIAMIHKVKLMNDILLFWIAFVFTRPFGATFGDFLTKPIASGGLELDTLLASGVSIVVMTLLILTEHLQREHEHITSI